MYKVVSIFDLIASIFLSDSWCRSFMFCFEISTGVKIIYTVCSNVNAFW